MPIPTTYTEKQLAEYMHSTLGKVAAALDLHFDPDGPGDYAEAVNNALLAYGAEDIGTISGIEQIGKLRALAAVAAWRHVVNNFAALYDFSVDGGTYSRGQLLQNAKEALQLAEQKAAPYDASLVGRVVRMRSSSDPYGASQGEENQGL